MATGLDVWVAAPGSACTVDDGAWTVTVYDAHGTPFAWAGMSYAALDAPHGHWAGAIPPGTYVVRAAQAKGTLVTDHAIAVVDCHEVACVRLYVPGKRRGSDRPEPERPEDCRVAIRSVTPQARERHVVAVAVEGAAHNCREVEVTVLCGDREARETVAVASNGRWKAEVDVAQFDCVCGGAARVTARCTEGDCGDIWTGDLDCGGDGEQPGGGIR